MANKIIFKITRKLSEEELQAIDIVKNLKSHGYEAYFAGGAVRDELLGLEVHDIDIATSAKPNEIQKIFSHTYDKGKSFGVICVRFGNFEFEVATFRTDIGTVDHRRPKKIEFTSAKNDATRRDFTINGLFYDPEKEEIIDYVEGLKDLKRKLIRFIGDPNERVEEDYLRMLRAVRFQTKLDFKLEAKTEETIKKNLNKINEISPERVRDELGKILMLPNRQMGILLLDELGILKIILPEIVTLKNVTQPPEFHSEGDVFEHTLLALKNILNYTCDSIEELVWTVLLHDAGKPQTIGFRSMVGKTKITFFDHDIRSAEIAHNILERYHFSHQFINNVTWAILQHMRIINAFRGMSERKQIKLFLDPNINLLLDLTKADLSASLRPNKKPDMKMYNDALKLKDVIFSKVSSEEEKQVKKFDLVTGKDIMDYLNIEPGPEVGVIKKEIEKEFLDGKINTRKDAFEYLKEYQK